MYNSIEVSAGQNGWIYFLQVWQHISILITYRVIGYILITDPL